MFLLNLSGLNRFHKLAYDTAESAGARGLPGSGAASSQQGNADMNISGLTSVTGPSVVRPSTAVPAAPSPAVSRSVAPQDRLEISAAGKMLNQLSQTPDVRQQRIAQIQQQIADGTYDTDEKLEAALLKLFNAVGVEFEE
jgi:flagellar biosynthesis anti-sigma factor FlgM